MVLLIFVLIITLYFEDTYKVNFLESQGMFSMQKLY